VRDLNRAYKNEPALWEVDFDSNGFFWLEPNDAESNVMAFARASRGHERVVVFVANLSPLPRGPYRLGVPRSGRWRELMNTDSETYGGTNTGNLGAVEAEPVPWHDQPYSVEITLPPLAALWLVPDGD
jgi:1,4-alpha-glucan branching enzyme